MNRLSYHEAVLHLKSMWVTPLTGKLFYTHMTPQLYTMFPNLTVCCNCNIFQTATSSGQVLNF